MKKLITTIAFIALSTVSAKAIEMEMFSITGGLAANNYFWLHGRRPFKENKELSRELLRIRGSFFD